MDDAGDGLCHAGGGFGIHMVLGFLLQFFCRHGAGAIRRDGKNLLKAGGQVFQHFAVILIFQQAKDRHKVAVISGFFQSCSKGCGTIGIVAAHPAAATGGGA